MREPKISGPVDVHSVGHGDYIKVGGEYHEIMSIEFERKDGVIRNWIVSITGGGEEFGMLEIASYHKSTPAFPARRSIAFDFKHESSACINELFYRDGPAAKDIKRTDAYLVSEIVERYMREAAEAVGIERDIAVTELAVLQGHIIAAIATIKLLHDMYARNKETLPQYEAIGVVLDRLETLKARIK